MKQNFLLLLVLFALAKTPLFAQFKPQAAPGTHKLDPNTPPQLSLPTDRQQPDKQKTALQYDQHFFGPARPLRLSDTSLSLRITRDQKTGLPIFIEGHIKPEATDAQSSAQAMRHPAAAAFNYMEYFKNDLQLEKPAEEWLLVENETDDLQYQHIRMRQQYKGLEVYGGEVRLHLKDGQVEVFNGRYFPTPKLTTTVPALTEATALERAKAHLSKTEKLQDFSPDMERMAGKQIAKKQLMVYHLGNNPDSARLTWYFEIAPAVLSRWAYFVDAQTGEILDRFSLVCHFMPDLGDEAGHAHNGHEACVPGHTHTHISPEEELAQQPPVIGGGPAPARGRDLNGQNQQFGSYLIGEKYWLIDASKSIFDASQGHKLPNAQDIGVLFTLDAQNKVGPDGKMQLYGFTNTNTNWDREPFAVSAHVNASKAFDYFYNVFGRKSIKDKSEDVVSIINAPDEDGKPMDNAFWNGEAMFYGSGNTLFYPLAKALDVGGHEMAHGVIGSTANLEYRNESGALNESFADIFGVMIDRDDWKLAEDCVKPGAFPTGAMRDMSNPNNGGTNLSDLGWQPKHMREKYTGEKDNGGVHVNSGIVNYAFYLFATKVGKDKAEKIYYRALTQYLTRSSQFSDARLAIMRAAKDLEGDAVAEEVGKAFDAVGIGAGNGGGNQPQKPVNTGNQYVLATDAMRQGLHIFRPDGSVVAGSLMRDGVLSRPSITDDGSIIVYVNREAKLRYVSIDWGAGKFTSGFLDETPQWRNVVISKDGSRVAATTDAYDAQVLVVDFTTEPATSKVFELYAPTYVEGVKSDVLQYSDAMEFDLSGQFLLFDSYNSLPIGNFESYDYWDMGLAKIWDNTQKTYAPGYCDRIFNSLSYGENIGNPSFSKNSPGIIAFDYAADSNDDGVLDTQDQYAILGFNFETGKLGLINEGGITAGYPSYATNDGAVLFNALNESHHALIGYAQVGADKINAASPTHIFKPGYQWGVYFATGKRPLTSSLHPAPVWTQGEVTIAPNPAQDAINLRFDLPKAATLDITLLDPLGRLVQRQQIQAAAGSGQHSFAVQSLPAGLYYVRLQTEQQVLTKSVMVQR